MTRVAFFSPCNKTQTTGEKKRKFNSFLIFAYCRVFFPFQQFEEMFFQYNKIIYVLFFLVECLTRTQKGEWHDSDAGMMHLIAHAGESYTLLFAGG